MKGREPKASVTATKWYRRGSFAWENVIFTDTEICHLVTFRRKAILKETTWTDPCIMNGPKLRQRIVEVLRDYSMPNPIDGQLTIGYVKATWLILPVVIRSSQRLSHARLSINVILWNCELLITTVIVYLIIPYYLDNRSNSRANTCINARLLAERQHLLDKSQPFSDVILVIHNTFANRTTPCRRWIIQVSALLDLDGSVLDYHVVDG